MNCEETILLLFRWRKRIYLGKVYVHHIPGMYYFSLFLNNEEKVFFVDDENDRWIENHKGSKVLANRVGDAIDRHYHPSLSAEYPPFNPDQSLFFP